MQHPSRSRSILRGTSSLVMSGVTGLEHNVDGNNGVEIKPTASQINFIRNQKIVGTHKISQQKQEKLCWVMSDINSYSY